MIIKVSLDNQATGTYREAHLAFRQHLTAQLGELVQLMAQALKAGGKIVTCGNGGSWCDAQHLAVELVGRFVAERRPLPAVCLGSEPGLSSALANDYGYDVALTRQALALTGDKDIFIAYTTSGRSANVVNALSNVTRFTDAVTVTITGREVSLIHPFSDYIISIDSTSTQVIQEITCVINHALAAGVDQCQGSTT